MKYKVKTVKIGSAEIVDAPMISKDGKILSEYRFAFWLHPDYVESKWNKFVRVFSWRSYSYWVHPLLAITTAIFLLTASVAFVLMACSVLSYWMNK